MTSAAPSTDLYVPSFVGVTFIGARDGVQEYTVSNEASGRHFSANKPTVEFIEALRATGSLPYAASQAKMPVEAAQGLLAQLMRFGVVVQRGQTNQETAKSQTPIESRAVMIRFDLFDAARFVRRCARLGQLLFSAIGFALWCALAVLALSALLLNQDKIAVAVSRIPDTGFGGVAAFLLLLVALKALHEMGHALAYQEMCRRADLEAGPIRMGISIFALTPFPFTDVTGAWRLRERVPRAIIGAGGLYLEFFLVFMATLFWANTGDGWLQTAIFQVVMFSAVSSLLFNLNPAVKLDGYYILSDLLAFPNLAGRASQAAQAWFGRRLGAETPKPGSGLLVYWLLSYLYRWVIFAGIFWVAYQLDPRFAAPVFGIVLLMLVVRPFIRSVQHALKQSAKPKRLVVAGACLGLATLAALIPFTDRVLLGGHLSRYETTFLHVPEPAKLTLAQNGLPRLESLDLAHEQQDLTLQRQIIENANRAVSQSQSGADRARLQTDLAQISEMQTNLDTRARTLQVKTDALDIWTPLSAEDFADAWVRPGQGAIGAISRPQFPRLVLWMEQSDFEVGLLTYGEGELTVRLGHNPDCEFAAKLDQTEDQLAVQGDALLVHAVLQETLPACLQNTPSGTAVVARLPARPKSVAERGWNTIQRALQDRLPVELLLENEQTR